MQGNRENRTQKSTTYALENINLSKPRLCCTSGFIKQRGRMERMTNEAVLRKGETGRALMKMIIAR